MYKFKLLDNSNKKNSIFVQGQQPNTLDVTSDTASIIFQNTSNNISEVAIRNNDLIMRSMVTGSNMRLSANGYLNIGRSPTYNEQPKEMLELYNGNVVSKNIIKLTKTLGSFANIDVLINWENMVSTDQFFMVLETCQQVSDGLQVAVKTQKHLVRLYKATDNTSPQIKFSQVATTFGNTAAATAMSIVSLAPMSTSLTIRSSINWPTATGTTPSHTFTVEVIQAPDSAAVGFSWLQ